MTEKMTEAERGKIEEFVEAGHVLSDDQASALLVEVERARGSEAALADALNRRTTLEVAPCVCHLTAPLQCNNCTDRILLANLGYR